MFKISNIQELPHELYTDCKNFWFSKPSTKQAKCANAYTESNTDRRKSVIVSGVLSSPTEIQEQQDVFVNDHDPSRAIQCQGQWYSTLMPSERS